jgi:hypothetical protein
MIQQLTINLFNLRWTKFIKNDFTNQNTPNVRQGIYKLVWLSIDGELTHNNNNRAIRGGNKIPQTCKNLWGPTHK